MQNVCAKVLLILRFSDPYFPAFRLNTVDLLCKSPYLVQMREDKDQNTPNTDTFYAMNFCSFTLSGFYRAHINKGRDSTS